MAKKILYQLNKKVGDHIEDGKTYKAGERVESTRDLPALFRNKFTKVHPDDVLEPDKMPNIPSPTNNDEGAETSKSSAPKNHKKHGENVSHLFEDAAISELVVYKKANWYAVVDPGTEEVVNAKKLRKKDVAGFLSQFVDTDEDEDDDEDEEEDEDE